MPSLIKENVYINPQFNPQLINAAFRAKPAEPAAPALRAASSAGWKKDTVASLFSARRPARRVVQGGKATRPGDQKLK